MAKRRFAHLERRFDKDPSLRERYTNFIKEFMDLKHLEAVPKHQIEKTDAEVFYLPHHCVLKDSSTTTKLIVVFDASAVTTSGHSLNDCLMTGPKLQDDLFEIIIRFRFHRVALSADVAKMY